MKNSFSTVFAQKTNTWFCLASTICSHGYSKEMICISIEYTKNYLKKRTPGGKATFPHPIFFDKNYTIEITVEFWLELYSLFLKKTKKHFFIKNFDLVPSSIRKNNFFSNLSQFILDIGYRVRWLRIWNLFWIIMLRTWKTVLFLMKVIGPILTRKCRPLWTTFNFEQS